jgi:hypothetical protein
VLRSLPPVRGALRETWTRPTVARTLVVLCVAGAVLIAVIQVPLAVSRLDHRANHFASLNFDDREFAAGNGIYPDTHVLYAARAAIPSHGTYRVAAGLKHLAGRTNLTKPFALTFARSFLLPRLPAANARWVICVGCDVSQLPGAHVTWTDGAGSSLLRVGT